MVPIMRRLLELNAEIDKALKGPPQPDTGTQSQSMPRSVNRRFMLNAKVHNAQPASEPTVPVGKDAWTGLFTGSKLAGKGVALAFLAPIYKEGKKIAQLQKTDVDIGTEKWLNSVVLYVVGDTPTIASVNRFISSTWNHVAEPVVYLHDDGYFIITRLKKIKMKLFMVVHIHFITNLL